MASAKKAAKLRKEMAKLEEKLREIDEEMDDLELRLLKASGSKKTTLESKLDRLDVKWDLLDKKLAIVKSDLAVVDPSYHPDDGDDDSEGGKEKSREEEDSSAKETTEKRGKEEVKKEKSSKAEKEKSARAEKERAKEEAKEKEKQDREAARKKEKEEREEKEAAKKKEREDREAARKKEREEREEKEAARKKEREEKGLAKREESKKRLKVEGSDRKLSKTDEKEEKKMRKSRDHSTDGKERKLSKSVSSATDEEEKSAGASLAVPGAQDDAPKIKKKSSVMKTLKMSISPYNKAEKEERKKLEDSMDSGDESVPSDGTPATGGVGGGGGDGTTEKKEKKKVSIVEDKATNRHLQLEGSEDRREKRKSKLLSRWSIKVSITDKKKGKDKDKDMDEGQVETQFLEFLEQIGVTNPKLRELWQDEYKTTKQKQELIKTLESNSKLSSTLGDELTAQMMSQQLKNNPDEQALEKVLLNFRTATVSWLKEFQQAGGIGHLFEAFTFEFFKVAQAGKAKAEKDRDGPMSNTKLELCVTCIEEGVNNNAVGVDELEKRPEVLQNLLLSTEFVSLEQRSAIVELLAAISLIDPRLHLLVVQALEYFKGFKLGVFREFMEELEEGDDLDFKVSLFSLINTVVVLCADIEERVKTRGIFMSEGLGEMVEVLITDYPDKELQEQLKAFKEELDQDCKEAGIQHVTEATGDPSQLLASLTELMQGTGLEMTLVKVLEHVFKLGIPNNAKETWSALEALLGHFGDVVRSGECKGGEASEEDFLMKMLVRAQSGKSESQVFKAAAVVKDDDAPSQGEPAAAPPPPPAPPMAPPAPPPAPGAPAPAPPPPPPGPGGPPPPPGIPGPPPPPGMPGPPPPPGMPGPPGMPPPPGMGMAASFRDPTRPKMVPWRWNALPANQLNKTIFKDIDSSKVQFDSEKLINLFRMDTGKKPVKLGESKNGEEKKKKEDEKLPVVLDRQRCTIIEIIMKRFEEPASKIKEHIINCNLKWLNTTTISELLSLFPLKSYDSERDMLLKFSGDHSTFHRAEAFLYELFTIKAVRQKLVAANFCLEFGTKEVEYQQNIEVVDNAFEEIKRRKVKRLMEYLLAIGNFMNNPNRECKGFKFSALMKLNDVRSRGETKVTLMHALAEIIAEKEPELLTIVDEMNNVAMAADACNAVQANIAFTRNSNTNLKKMLEVLDQPEDKDMREFFEKVHASCNELLEGYQEKLTGYEETVLFYGEQNTNDIPAFFQTWAQFVTSFRSAIKFNIAKAKKEAKLEEQAKLEKKKQKEQNTIKKFTNTLRISRKNLKQELKKIEAGEGMDAQPSPKSDARSKSRARHGQKKKVHNLVDDILSSNPTIMAAGPTATVRDDTGVIKQISKGLKSSDTFSRLRGKRMASLAGKDSAAGSSAASQYAGPGRLATSQDIRATLKNQKSTLSRADVSKFRQFKKRTMKTRAPAPEPEDKPVRPSLSSIKWG